MLRPSYPVCRAPATGPARRILSTLCLLLAPVLAAYGQGKIAGSVSEAGTGDPLIGVNVVIEGTQQGTVTDEDGNYVIVNVRPDEYTLVFSFIGFQSQRVEGVRVTTGQTTRQDAALREQVIEGGEIVVQAERPLVQKDLTASKKTVVAEEIEALPVESFFDVMSTQAGVTQGADGALHIRGGRSNEISYLVDGLSVGNPFNTNGLATTVATDAIQEMTVISGAFNAEYGKAMSGIVNLVTKEGGDRLEGSVSAYGGDYVTRHDDIFFTPSELGLNVYTLEGTLSGPIPFFRALRFFVSGRHDADNGYIYGIREHLPSDSANFNVSPWYYEIHGRPWQDYTDHTVVGEDGSTQEVAALPLPDERVAMNDRNSTNVLGKLTTRPFSGAKVEYSFLYDEGDRTPFGAAEFAYRFNPDGVARQYDRGYNHSLHWTHTINPTTFYNLRLSYAVNRFSEYLYKDPTDARYVKDLGTIGDGTVIGFPGTNFLFSGNQKSQVFEASRSLRGKLDVTKQFGFIHEVKAGAEVQLHNLDRENFTVLYDGSPRYPSPTVPPLTSPAHDRYEDQKVAEFSAYAQDKMEFENFIINAGLRFERFNPNGYYIPDLLAPTSDSLAQAEAKNLLLPRLGVSFPITDAGIIHFSYGHFAQMPPLRRLYTNPEFEFPVGALPTYGNTNMRPERTVQYELGLQQQIGGLLAFDVTGFFKDIRDYLAPQRIQFSTIAGENEYRIYLNKDYANVKGMAFSLTKRRAPSGLLSATLNYTFQVAEGGDDDTDAFFFNALSDRENELVVVPLDFDQRHVIATTVTLTQPGNWGFSLIGQFSTGYPYTPLILDQNFDQQSNSGRKPSQLTLDLHLYKDVSVGPARLRLFAKAYNVLDQLNERFVFDETGRATYSLSRELNLDAAWRGAYGQPGIHTIDEYDTRPHYYSPPRELRLGLTLGF